MKDLKLDQIRVALGEPNMQMRGVLKAALLARGVGDVIDIHNFKGLHETILRPEVDLLITDIHLGHDDPGTVCELIRAVRHHEIKANPFLPIIAITGDADRAVVARIIDSGADHLMAKPLSMTQLEERIAALVKSRKPFVITSDYIGPDRRSKERAATTDVPRMEVPNILREKAAGNAVDADKVQRAIDTVSRRINGHKMERHAMRLVDLARDVLAAYETYSMDAGTREDLHRMAGISEDLERRTQNTSFAPVSELCDSLVAVSQWVSREGAKAGKRQVRLLPELAQAIQVAFKMDPHDEKTVDAITDTVRRAQDKVAAAGMTRQRLEA